MAEDLDVEPCGRGDCDCCSCWWRREAALRAEVSSLRSEVSSLRSEVERLTLSFEVCQNGSKGIIKKWKASEVRERRSAERLAVCLEALEIARRMADDNQNHLEDLNGPKPCPAECDACQLRKALSPAPGSQEAERNGQTKIVHCACGETTLIQFESNPNHGVKVYCIAQDKGSGFIYDTETEGQAKDGAEFNPRSPNHRQAYGYILGREKALKEAAEIAGRCYCDNELDCVCRKSIEEGILALLKKDEGRVG